MQRGDTFSKFYPRWKRRAVSRFKIVRMTSPRDEELAIAGGYFPEHKLHESTRIFRCIFGRLSRNKVDLRSDSVIKTRTFVCKRGRKPLQNSGVTIGRARGEVTHSLRLFHAINDRWPPEIKGRELISLECVYSLQRYTSWVYRIWLHFKWDPLLHWNIRWNSTGLLFNTF